MKLPTSSDWKKAVVQNPSIHPITLLKEMTYQQFPADDKIEEKFGTALTNRYNATDLFAISNAFFGGI